MLVHEIETHREVVTLHDGARVLIRPMLSSDGPLLTEYFRHVHEEDMRYMRHNVKDPDIIQGWCENLNYQHVFPLLALVKDRIVGSASLHFFSGPRRHIAEYRLFLARDFRQRGLGMKMTRSMIEIARRQNIRTIVGEIIAEKTKVVRAFEQLGFVSKCMLEDYFMFPDGDTCDVVFLMLDLKPRGDEF